MSLTLTPQSVALLTIGQVNADLMDGTIPATVRTFADLHDYVDANEYLINVLCAAEVELDAADEEQADLFNEAMEEVSRWLNNRYHRIHGTTPAPGRHS